MSYQNGTEDHGSTKLALSKFANAHSMAFLGMVLLLGSMIFDQVSETTTSIVTHCRVRFSTTHFANQQLPYINARSLFALLGSQN